MKLDLKNKEWKEFTIEKLFSVSIGKNIDGNKIDKESGKKAYITRKESNNGLDGFVDYSDEYLNINYPVITIGNETSEPFVQDFPFFTGTKVNILFPYQQLSKECLFFIAQALRMHKKKYSYSYTINSTRLKKQKILLPVNEQGDVDYAFMGVYISELKKNKQHKYSQYILSRFEKLKNTPKPLSLKDKEWKEFKLTDIFTEIQRGKRLKKDDHIKGKIPYASSTSLNNGIDDFIDNTERVRIFENCLTLANSGSVGATFYQPFKVVASDHVTKLKNVIFNKYIYQFLATTIKRIDEKYSFNREINDARIKNEIIVLPIKSDETPDYQYMENYMKYLEYQKLKEYLEFIKSRNN